MSFPDRKRMLLTLLVANVVTWTLAKLPKSDKALSVSGIKLLRSDLVIHDLSLGLPALS